MKTLNSDDKQSQMVMSHDELLIINAALNEVCNGIDISEFQTRIGADRERVAALLKVIGRLLDQMDEIRVKIDADC